MHLIIIDNPLEKVVIGIGSNGNQGAAGIDHYGSMWSVVGLFSVKSS